MLNLISFFIAKKQALIARVVSLARDSAAIARFLSIALSPRGALGASYRFESVLFFRSTITALAPQFAYQSWREAKRHSKYGPILFALLMGWAFCKPDIYVALPLSSTLSQIAPCAVFQGPSAIFTVTRWRWPADDWGRQRSLALSHGDAVMMVPKNLYDQALALAQLSRQEGRYAPSDTLHPTKAQSEQCAAQANAFLREHGNHSPDPVLAPLNSAFLNALLPGAGFLDFKAAATRALARSPALKSIPQDPLARAMESSLKRWWDEAKTLFVIFFLGNALAPIALVFITFLTRLTLAAARFLANVSDPGALSRISRAQLTDELPSASAKGASSRPRPRL